MDVMKYLKVLQALFSIQAYRSNLKVYAQIGISERGKVRTLVNVGVNRAVIGKAEWYNLSLSDGERSHSTEEATIIRLWRDRL